MITLTWQSYDEEFIQDAEIVLQSVTFKYVLLYSLNVVSSVKPLDFVINSYYSSK